MPPSTNSFSKECPPPGSPLIRLVHLIREVKFGTITFRVRDGGINRDMEPSVKYTRKPQPRRRTCHDLPAGEVTFDDAMHDLSNDINNLRGEWQVTIKVANALPQSWERERIGVPSK